MKWFWRYVWNKMKQIGNEPDEPVGLAISSKNASVRMRDEFEAEEGLNMQVHKAIGGRIVAFNHYDRKTDRSYRKVYVVHDELDFERELGKIITMESMRG